MLTIDQIVKRIQAAQSTGTKEVPASAAFPSRGDGMPQIFVMWLGDEWKIHHLDANSDSYEREITDTIAIVEGLDDESFGAFAIPIGGTSYWIVDHHDLEGTNWERKTVAVFRP